MARRDDNDDRLRLGLWDWLDAWLHFYRCRRDTHRHLRRVRGDR